MIHDSLGSVNDTQQCQIVAIDFLGKHDLAKPHLTTPQTSNQASKSLLAITINEKATAAAEQTRIKVS